MGIKNDEGADRHTHLRVYEGCLVVVGLDSKLSNFDRKNTGNRRQDYGKHRAAATTFFSTTINDSTEVPLQLWSAPQTSSGDSSC
jgi:hypothetical protein